MRKLLRANLFRLLRDRVFQLALAVMFLLGTALPVIHALDNLNNGEAWTPDASCFVFAIPAPILLSVVTALFVGSEYSEGTLRNKIIAGHRRPVIYLANLTVGAAAGLAVCFAYLLPHTILSLTLLGRFENGMQTLLLYAALNAALSAAFAALFTLIAMLCPNKAYSTAGCILLVFALLFAGVSITSALNEPEYYSGYSYTENGVTTTEEPMRNPNYLEGTKRRVYEFMQDFTPGGQMLQLANMHTEKPALLALYDGIILLAATGGGIVFFRRRNLK